MKVISVPKLRQAYNEAMKFFDDKCEEFQSKTNYQPLVKMVVENRRLELINKMSRHFNAEFSGPDILSFVNDIKEIEEKTTKDLQQLRAM